MANSLSSALKALANYRANNTRASQDIYDKGTVVLRAGKAVKGDEGAFHEPYKTNGERLVLRLGIP